MKVNLFIMIFVALLYSCDEFSHPKKVNIKEKNTAESNNSTIDTTFKLKIFDTIVKNMGFVGLTETKHPLNFLNSDKSPYKNISFIDLSKSNTFEPYAYHADYHLLWFRCTKLENGYYTVIINESNKNTKLLKVDNNKLTYSTWENLILHSFSVYYDFKSNPLRERPNWRAKSIEYNKDELYFPVQIIGEWLKVKWGRANNENFGYIKWKDGSKILVELSFFA
jgi:hypothetical protein